MNEDSHHQSIRLPSSAFAAFLYLIMFGVYLGNARSAFTLTGITDLLNNTVVLALAAAGLTLVILAAELDLSSVGVIAVANVMVATLSTKLPGGAFTSLVLVVAVGLLVGSINGWLVVGLGLPSLASTLGVMIMCQGIALLVLEAPGGEVAGWITDRLTDTVLGLVPVAALILVVLIGGWLVLRRTRFGIALYAVGTDPVASRLTGLDVKGTKWLAFALAGLAYGLAGYLLSAQTGTGDPRVNNSFLLYLFAAVAIGGTSLEGGRGGVIGSVVGAGILTVMQKMLFALGVAEFYTNIFNGVIMVLAILFGNLSALLAFKQRMITSGHQGGQYTQS